MRIVGLTPTSLIDWDGYVVSVIFLGGCNLRCPYCYNSDLARDDPELEQLSWDKEVVPVLTRKPGFLDGVVLLGGEPMIHPEVFGLCRQIRKLGLKVKVDTNGCFPYPLKDLIEKGLCDSVAMDVKAPLTESYLKKATGVGADSEVIRRSIRLLLESEIDYEFRTTLVPGIVGSDNIADIGKEIQGARRWTLQGFLPANAMTAQFRNLPGTTQADTDRIAELAAPFVEEVRLRGKFV